MTPSTNDLTKKVRGICRGLIEADARSISAYDAHKNSAASAAASLKQQPLAQQAMRHRENSAASAAASLKRETRSERCRSRNKNSAASAAASLKLAAPGFACRFVGKNSAASAAASLKRFTESIAIIGHELKCRGLIEAGTSCGRTPRSA